MKKCDNRLTGFHITHTRPTVERGGVPYIHDFELLGTIMSALQWRFHNGPIKLYTDTKGLELYESQNMTFVWDAGIDTTLLDSIEDPINFSVFWAASKLYALRDMDCPCVMIDTDMIVWGSLDKLIDKEGVTCIHKEAISGDIYLPKELLKIPPNYHFDPLWDWSVLPSNTALLYFGNSNLKDYYTSCAFEFMRNNYDLPKENISQMVFAEQRLLSICAQRSGVEVKAFLDFNRLDDQQLFTHFWGEKEPIRRSKERADELCRDLVDRLFEDFRFCAEDLRRVPVVAKYLD